MPPPGTSSRRSGPAVGPSPRPTTSSRVATRRPGGPAAPLPADTAVHPLSGEPEPPGAPRPAHPSGENPSLEARLEGLASRGRLSLAPPPSQEVEVDFRERSSGPRPTTAPGPYGDTYGDDAYTDTFEGDTDRSTRRGCGRAAIALLVVAAVLCAAVVAGGLWVRGKIDPPGEPGDPVTVEVVEGQSTGDIGNLLEDAGVITDAGVWTWYVRFKGGGDIQAGSYEMRHNMSMGQALDTLQADPAPVVPRTVTIEAGETIEQMVTSLTDPTNGVRGFDAQRLRDAFNAPENRSRFLPPDAVNPEGLFFAERYTLEENETEMSLVRRMVTQMDIVLGELQVEARAAGLGFSVYDVLKIASMVEEETSLADERGMVARLIYNRLARPMALQIDATSCYNLPTPCDVGQAVQDEASPYNTRNTLGLTPTPISNPSRASIEAALNPTPGDWIYSVLDPQLGEGRHLFTSSYDDFLAARQRCQDAELC